MKSGLKLPVNSFLNCIVRIAPGNERVVFEVNPEFDEFLTAVITADGNKQNIIIRNLGQNTYEATGLQNDTDYIIELKNKFGDRGNPRLFRCGHYPGAVVNYIHPDDKTFLPSGMCPASPSIIREKSGRLYVSHDIFSFDHAQNQTKVFLSDDNGVAWNYHSSIEGCFWGKLFIYRDKIYMLGNIHEYGDMVLYKMDKGKCDWVKSCTVIQGGNKYTGGPHKSAMPIIEHNNRIWTAIEYGSWQLGGHACGFVSASGDIENPDNWIVSGFTEYNPEWPGTPNGKSTGCIEGNMVVTPDGKLIDFLRYNIDQCTPNYGRAMYLYVNTENPTAAPEFGKVVDFQGNHSKFCIYYDSFTEKYWTIVNRADKEKPKRRNELILMSSEDIDNWVVEKVLLDYENTGWYENYEKTGFQYIDFIFKGDFIFYVSRTAINGAINYHDSNCITFHTIRYK